MAEPASTHMTAEIGEAPEAVRRQETSLAGPLNELLLRLKAQPPRVVVTAARGSSAHAATFAKHAIERTGARSSAGAGCPRGWSPGTRVSW